MTKLSRGVHFCCPENKLHHHRHNDAFVDDVTGYANSFAAELNGRNVLPDVLSTMQRDATTWSRLLHTSGGKLALQKCLYYIVSWQWSNGHHSPIPAINIQPKIQLQTDNNEEAICHKDCHQAHRTLGQYKTPTGDQQAQYTHMTMKSQTWLSAIREASLTRREALAAYESIWFPSLSYGLETTNLSFTELNNLQKPIINHLLPILGYNRHFPRAVVYGSKHFGGLGLKHLYITQGVKHITSFIKYYRSNNNIGKLLSISLRWLHLIAGLSYCPLRRPSLNLHHIQDKWFSTTIQFLYETNSSIETIESIRIYNRQHDSSLIEDFLLFEPSHTELTLLNQCCIFLHVTSLSDIATINGTSIHRNCWEGTTPNPSPLLWPKQGPPSAKAWRVWRLYLSQCYLANDLNHHPRRQDLQLRTPLGTWLPNHHNQQSHEFYINPTTLSAYQRTTNDYTTYRPYLNTRTQIHFKSTGKTSYLPQAAHPIQPAISACDSLCILKCHIDHTYRMQPRPQPLTIKDYFQTLDPWETQLLQHFQIRTKLDNLLDNTLTPFLIASDGSVDQGKGSFGWAIAQPDGTILVTGHGTAFGHDISSFRAEAYGILAPLRFILRTRQFFHIPTPTNTITWWCDSKSLLSRIASTSSTIPNPNRSNLADHDLEHTIALSFKSATTSFTQQHLRSHQCDNTPLHQLPVPQRLNRIADNLASQHNQQMLHPEPCVPLVTPAQCQLHINKHTVTNHYNCRLSNSYTHNTLVQHIRQRLNLPTDTINSIAWPEFSRAFKSFSTNHQRFLRRWLYGFLPTQRRLHRYGDCPSPTCPKCLQSNETDHHFLICGGVNDWSKTLFDPLEKLCRKLQATHWVETTITLNLIHCICHSAPVASNTWIEPAFLSQSRIGWANAFYGIFSTDWITFQNKGPIQNGSKLITRIIHTVFTAIIERWNTRNTLLHKPAPNNETRLRLTTKVCALYDCRNKVLRADQKIFAMPLTELLEKPTSTLQHFVASYTTLVKTSIKQQQRLLQLEHRDITIYFTRIPRVSTHTTTRVVLGS